MYFFFSMVNCIFLVIDICVFDSSEIIFDYVYFDVFVGENILYGLVEVLEGLKNIGEYWIFGIEKGYLLEFFNKYYLKLYCDVDVSILEMCFFINK